MPHSRKKDRREKTYFKGKRYQSLDWQKITDSAESVDFLYPVEKMESNQGGRYRCLNAKRKNRLKRGGGTKLPHQVKTIYQNRGYTLAKIL